MRLIDADALADALFDKRKNYPQWVADTICNMPDVVVRCKDCRHYPAPDSHGDRCAKIHWSRSSNWFCADGERNSD